MNQRTYQAVTGLSRSQMCHPIHVSLNSDKFIRVIKGGTELTSQRNWVPSSVPSVYKFRQSEASDSQNLTPDNPASGSQPKVPAPDPLAIQPAPKYIPCTPAFPSR